MIDHFVRVIPKPELQGLLKAIRHHAATTKIKVNKVCGGYEAIGPDGVLVLRAMNGQAKYLCRFHRDHFKEVERMQSVIQWA